MVFRRRMGNALRPVVSTKNVIETSGILAAGVNTVALTLIDTADSASLAVSNSVERGSKVNGIFLSIFFYTEGGEVANEVPLVDWYILKNNGDSLAGFGVNDLPIPGSSGISDNKRYIFHTEKGLAGGGNASLAGVPMVFKGVIALPRGFRKMNANDRVIIVARANFATKFCIQSIYKWYH